MVFVFLWVLWASCWVSSLLGDKRSWRSSTSMFWDQRMSYSIPDSCQTVAQFTAHRVTDLAFWFGIFITHNLLCYNMGLLHVLAFQRNWLDACSGPGLGNTTIWFQIQISNKIRHHQCQWGHHWNPIRSTYAVIYMDSIQALQYSEILGGLYTKWSNLFHITSLRRIYLWYRINSTKWFSHCSEG